MEYCICNTVYESAPEHFSACKVDHRSVTWGAHALSTLFRGSSRRSKCDDISSQVSLHPVGPTIAAATTQRVQLVIDNATFGTTAHETRIVPDQQWAENT
jgi:hypothetical protein